MGSFNMFYIERVCGTKVQHTRILDAKVHLYQMSYDVFFSGICRKEFKILLEKWRGVS